MSPPTELNGVPPGEPLAVLARWLDDARRDGTQPNPNAMVLATCDAAGRPSARVVLCKDLAVDLGYIVFFTNYLSRKGRELAATPRAAAVFHWDTLHRQARIEGPVLKSPSAESDAYFASRPWQSRIGAWASRQSEPTESRAALEQALAATARRFAAPSPDRTGEDGPFDGPIARPPHWGGYRLWAESIELWVEGDARIHDRLLWTRSLRAHAETLEAGPWTVTRLQP
jgi:pyridoxamine 5'-phosphate oxidase